MTHTQNHFYPVIVRDRLNCWKFARATTRTPEWIIYNLKGYLNARWRLVTIDLRSKSWKRANQGTLLQIYLYKSSTITRAPSTRIRKFVKTQFFFYEYGLRPHVSSVFSGRIQKFLKTLSRVEIFLSDTNSYTCGRSYPQICEYAYVIFLNPVFTSSIINKHGVQQGCIFFVNCSDF